MKQLVCIMLTATALTIQAAHQEHEAVKVFIEPKWQDLENDSAIAQQFGGKWILVGSITFKKKSTMPVALTKLELHWNGTPLHHLMGSLYDKPLDKEFMAVEETLLSDGHWNQTTQTLILKFNKRKTLNAVNVFYVVLTVPEHLESTLKRGSFDVCTSSLPHPIAHDSLRLSLDVFDSESISQ